MSSRLPHSMEGDLIDNAFLTMMLVLRLLQESQPEEVPNKVGTLTGGAPDCNHIESKLLFE
jgi:hypothetical protein